jgi:predicted TPR repeat methyltransferase
MIAKRYETIGKLSTNKKLLDVGCGAGLGLEYLSLIVKKVNGIDYEKSNIKIAKEINKNIKNIHLEQMDAHKTRFKNNYFEVLSAMQVVQYLNIELFFKEVKRILCKKGVLVFSIPNIERKDGFKKSKYSVKYHTTKEYLEMLKKNGFEAKAYGIFPIQGNANNQTIKTLILRTINALISSTTIGKRIKEKLKQKSSKYTKINKITVKHINQTKNIKLKLITKENHRNNKITYFIATKK